jgi:hypothetical protein
MVKMVVRVVVAEGHGGEKNRRKFFMVVKTRG